MRLWSQGLEEAMVYLHHLGEKKQVVLLDPENFCSRSKLRMLPKPERGEGLDRNSWRLGRDCQQHQISL